MQAANAIVDNPEREPQAQPAGALRAFVRGERDECAGVSEMVLRELVLQQAEPHEDGGHGEAGAKTESIAALLR